LLERLDDPDWTVAQAASLALTNLTAMDLPFDALASPEERRSQAERWRRWSETVDPGRPPAELLDVLSHSPTGSLAAGCKVEATSVYKGPPAILTDGLVGPARLHLPVATARWAHLVCGHPEGSSTQGR